MIRAPLLAPRTVIARRVHAPDFFRCTEPKDGTEGDHTMASNQQIEEIGRGTGGSMMPGRDSGNGEDRGRNEDEDRGGGAVRHQGRRFSTSSPQSGAGEQFQSSNKQKQQKRNVAQSERAMSMVLGGSLLAVALSRRRPGGVAMALAGAGLMHRGVTGHCYGYQALGINTARSGEQQGARQYAAEVQRSKTI